MRSSWKLASPVLIALALPLFGTGCLLPEDADEATDEATPDGPLAAAPAAIAEETGTATEAQWLLERGLLCRRVRRPRVRRVQLRVRRAEGLDARHRRLRVRRQQLPRPRLRHARLRRARLRPEPGTLLASARRPGSAPRGAGPGRPRLDAAQGATSITPTIPRSACSRM
jgi:hypothetical protein